MAWRTAHGRARQLGKAKVWESVPDGPRSVPDGSAVRIERRKNGTFTSEGARAAVRKRRELAKLPDFGDAAAPWMPPAEELAPFDAARRELLAQRRDEVANATGGLSSGTGAILRGWSCLHAAGEYWAAKFFASGDPTAFESMTRAFKAASAEDAKARDGAAWEAKAHSNDKAPPALAAIEAAAERYLADQQTRADASAALPPTTDTPEAEAGSGGHSEPESEESQ